MPLAFTRPQPARKFLAKKDEAVPKRAKIELMDRIEHLVPVGRGGVARRADGDD